MSAGGDGRHRIARPTTLQVVFRPRLDPL